MFITDLAFRYLLRAVLIVVLFEIKDLVWGDPLEENESRSTNARSLSMFGFLLTWNASSGKNETRKVSGVRMESAAGVAATGSTIMPAQSSVKPCRFASDHLSLKICKNE